MLTPALRQELREFHEAYRIFDSDVQEPLVSAWGAAATIARELLPTRVVQLLLRFKEQKIVEVLICQESGMSRVCGVIQLKV
jgi:hypothetical protein